MRYSKCQEVPLHRQRRQSRPAERKRRAQKERRQKSGALFNSLSEWCNSSSERWERGARSLFLFICSPPPLQPTCTRLLRKKRAFFFQLPPLPPLSTSTQPRGKRCSSSFSSSFPPSSTFLDIILLCVYLGRRKTHQQKNTISLFLPLPPAPNQQRPLLCLVCILIKYVRKSECCSYAMECDE